MSDTEAAIAAATSHVDWAIELLGGELSTLPPKEAHAELERRLEKRSPVAADAVNLALADIREFSLDASNPKVLRTIASLYVHDLVTGTVEPRGTNEPCRCEGPVVLGESDDGVVTVKCGCSAAWPLKPWLSATIKRIQASEAKRLGRPLTPWEAHSIDDQCYFRTLPKGAEGVPGVKGP